MTTVRRRSTAAQEMSSARVRAAADYLASVKPKGPTDEIGAPANVGAGIPPWGSMYLGDDLEQTPELQWPESVITYHKMRNDAQLEGLFMGTTLPIRNYNWCIDRNGCDKDRTADLAKDMNLPVKGEGKRGDRQQGRSKGRFSHDRHIFHSMLTLVYGHYFFEQVGIIGDDGLWHLKKAAPRPPATIMKVEVDSKGGLASIQQNISTQIGQMAKPIPVDRLIAYVWDQEGANWFGRSMFRSCFANFLLKDRLIRVDAIKHQRNGMGLPVGIGSQGGGKEELQEIQKMTAQVKAGGQASVALPYGTSMTLEGVRGTLPDTIASVRFHNEEMARRFLMMFMQLGESTHGNRALGDSFIEFFQLNQDTVAKWYATTTTEHLIEDWWDWNVGPDDDATPILTYERDDDPRFAFGELAQLITAGLIEVDDELEEAVRQAMDLPEKDMSSIRVPAVPEPDPSADPEVDPANTPSPTTKAARRQGRSIRADASASPAVPLPDRPLRREPDQFEADAKVDFDLMDRTYSTKLETLFAQWRETVIPAQVAELEAAILKTAKLEKLAAIEAPALGRDLLHEVMLEMYHSGVSAAVAEAHAQDVFVETPNADDHVTNLLPRASAVDEVNARMLGQMAGSRALRLSGEASTKAEVAEGTKSYLLDLKHVMVRDRLGGALQAAYNTGRFAVFKEAPAGDYYASELLDNNTCAPCTDVDGTRYKSLGEAERDYVGGYVACQGGDRCRGTVVAVYGEV